MLKRIIHPQAITENMANKFFYMFWGSQDVYAMRSVNIKTGKTAYYPQCSNFWTSVCHKKIKDGVNCKACIFLCGFPEFVLSNGSICGRSNIKKCVEN